MAASAGDANAPRYFWRRALAFLVDLAIVLLLATLVVAALQPFVSAKLQAPSIINMASCQDVTELQRNSKIVVALDVQEDETFFATLCERSNLGLLKVNTLSLGAMRQNGVGLQTRAVFFPVDENLEQIRVFDIAPLVWLLVPLAFALCIRFLGNTPGKALTSLELQRVGSVGKTFSSLLGREYLRLWPFAVLGLFGSITYLFTVGSADVEELAKAASPVPGPSLAVILPIVVAVVLLAPHLVSLVRWRGRMFYDAILGFEVRKR